MHVLCILNSFPQEGHNKQGLFPIAIENHVKAGFNVAVLPIKGFVDRNGNFSSSENQIQSLCHKLRVKYVSYPAEKNRNIITYTLIIRLLGKSIAKSPWKNLAKYRKQFWLDFIWKHRNWLAGIHYYINKHGCPDFVSALQSCHDTGFLAHIIQDFYGIPYIIWEHQSIYARSKIKNDKSIYSDIIKACRKLLTVSPQLGKDIENSLDIRIPQLQTLPNPVPNENFVKPGTCNWLQKLKAERYVFASWTRWRDIKRLDLLLEAFAEVNFKYRETCLIIGGEPPNWAQEKITGKIPKEAVILVGQLDRDEIRCLAHECDCCVIPSDYETFGLPAIEAMAAGKPIVATECGGPQSIIKNPSLGCIVKRGKIDALAEGMIQVYVNRMNYDATRIISECKKHYSEASYLEKLRSLYKL